MTDDDSLYKQKYALIEFETPPWPESPEMVHIAPARWVRTLGECLDEGKTKVTIEWPKSVFRNYIKLHRDSSNLIFEERDATVIYTGDGNKL